ncbi:MAG: acireductone dioxygenase, partial [Gammaproteobacteria bacterium]|nr:acireductone dioxygenase [Gammaproteobacteria bacterium]
MSRLRIFSETDPANPMLTTSTHEFIAEQLGKIGVRLEQWQATAALEPGASHEAVLAAYKHHIDEIVREKGFRTVDVVSIAPDHPDREAMRRKFLDEHFHKED